MLSNRLAFVALAIGCRGAAAGGGYLATRQNTASTLAQAATGDERREPLPPNPSVASGSPVQETEAVVGEASDTVPPPAEAPPPGADRARDLSQPRCGVTVLAQK